MVAVAIASVILIRVFDVLAMGWADKVAGVVLGVIAGSVISAGVIMGMANLPYSSETGDEIVAELQTPRWTPKSLRSGWRMG